MPPVSAFLPSTVGMAILVGAASVPSGFTGNRLMPVAFGMNRNVPSGEYAGPSWPTVLSESRRLTPEAVPARQTSWYVDRSKTWSDTDRSLGGHQEAAVRADGAAHELAVRRHQPVAERLEDLVEEICRPLAYSWPTLFVPKIVVVP